MAETATSSRFHSRPRMSRPATTTSTNTMASYLSPQPTSPLRTAPVPKTPSPNYFDFCVDGSSYISDSPKHARNNWSSPSSAVRSAAAQSPAVVPHDQNPTYEAFRRQSEGKAFNLSGLNNFKSTKTTEPSPISPRTSNGPSFTFPPQDVTSSKTAPQDVPTRRSSHRASLDPSTSELSRSPKRLLSPGSATQSTRRGSPPTCSLEDGGIKSIGEDSSDNQPRFKLPLENLGGSCGPLNHHRRSETYNASNDSESKMMVTPEYVANLIESKPDEILMFDLRLSTQFATSHITSALNLCLPTTLLKRPSFTIKKLSDIFKDHEDRKKFETWKSTNFIIVYDANSVLPKDATVCFNTLNKFRTEGYEGSLLIIRGGFTAFANSFPSHVENEHDNVCRMGAELDGNGPLVAPVVGGCPMPSTDKPANPFFGNIRQNMDLIGGVGRIPLTHPTQATQEVEDSYPNWLKQASNNRDQGERVSNKFEQIEIREKKRMEDALTGEVVYSASANKQNSEPKVQIAGLEQGSKNRYNNIWPFEHSRVKLGGVPSHTSDYFNASYIQASYSNKRYISTQAPIPATFNDFWNVVWQQDVRVVVMLTAEKEGAQVKAHNYWDRKQYGSLQLDFLSEKRASLEPARILKTRQRPATIQRISTNSVNPHIPLATMNSNEIRTCDQPYVIVRKFTLRHEKFPFAPLREITQLQYSNWPDFGAPAHPAHLVGLVEQCDAVVRATNKSRSTDEPEPPVTRPVLVHCSAGCGRTGTFCTVDSVIDMLKRQRISKSPQPESASTLSPTSAEQSQGFFGAAATKTKSAARPLTQDAGVDVEGDWVQRDDQDLVEKTVEEFRHQRISMVQSLRQFVLCYESVMEWLADQPTETEKA